MHPVADVCDHATGIYIGYIGVKTSMKTLDHIARSEVAKESIHRLCEAIDGNRNHDHGNSKSDRIALDHISSRLSDEPDLTYSGTEVKLCVTDSHLEMISLRKPTFDEEFILFKHEMSNVSFASIGDKDTKEYVAYVAKDSRHGRACFVLDCGPKDAAKVLEAIGYRFQLRTNRLYNNNTLPKSSNSTKFNHLNSIPDSSLDARDVNEASYRFDNSNQCSEAIVAETRGALAKEPWFHGSDLSRKESEARLRYDGDFLVRESEPGQFVLSVMTGDTKLHLLFDSMGQVRTKERVFDDISALVRYHHDEGLPLVANQRDVYLRNGVRPQT